MTSRWTILTLLAWLGLVAFTLLRIARPPTPEALALEPGTAQAIFAHLEHIAAEPHPIGSPAHARVRQYLVDEIRKLGLPVEVQQAPLGSITNTPRWAEPDAILHNVMTRIEGTGAGTAVLVASHYDSAPESFGAGDDGAAVASMLDLLARSVNRSHANDLIFLFTDAEENCLCGARAFVSEHPWAADVGVVLNFEARGTAGKSVMFEATPGYGTLVRTFARNAVQPATSSLYQVVYELLPNDTDLTAFREAGKQGMNMAFIDGQQNYHTAADTVQNLDPRTVLHQYANMAAMLGVFADAELGPGGDEPVFFDLLGFGVVIYSELVAYAGAAAALVLFAYLVHDGIARQRLHVRSLAAASLLLVLSAVAVVWGMRLASGLVTANVDVGATIGKKLYLATCIVLGMLALAALLRLAARRVGRASTECAVYLLWCLLLLATTALLPGVSYIFLWPLLGVLLARSLPWRPGASRAAAEGLAFVPLLVIWSQLAYALLLAMSVASITLVVTPMLLAGALLQTSRLWENKAGT